jgi:hypothetical protein
LSSTRRYTIVLQPSLEKQIGKSGFVEQVASLETKAYETCSLFITVMSSVGLSHSRQADCELHTYRFLINPLYAYKPVCGLSERPKNCHNILTLLNSLPRP